MNIEDKIHLEFIHNRLIDVYGENRNTDFVKRLRVIINDEPKGQELPIHIVSGSMADKAQMINALTNTMAVNKKELGGYHSLRDNSLEKLDKLIKSIDI